MNSIIWRGVSSETIQGLLISELPPITKPAVRVTETVVDGRDGSIIEELGYESYDKPLVIGLYGKCDINKVIKYFTGSGEVIFSNEPDKVYTAKIIAQIDYTRLLRYRQATVMFRVQPFKKKLNEAYKETQTATATGTNIVLKDSGKTPLRIETAASEIVVHGKNLVNNIAMNAWTNTTLEISNNGYTIFASGGSNSTYTHSGHSLPLAMRGKTYTLSCDKITGEQAGVSVGAQVVVESASRPKYYGVFNKGGSTTFTIPTDATTVFLSIYTNNTNTILETDNSVIFEGLRLVSADFKNDAWCPYDGVQTLKTTEGITNGTGYSSGTTISNADNSEMTVEYIKRYEVFNEGIEDSKPLMLLKGSGSVVVSVNGYEIFQYTFPEGENEVVIDSEAEDAYLGSVLKNRNMNGEFPTLVPGINVIEWSGNVSSIEVLPRSRWI